MADGSPQIPTPVRTTEQPPEGLRSCLISLDFTTQTQIDVDFYLQIAQHQLSAVRTLFLDNYDGVAPLIAFFLETQQRLVVPPKTQVYVPVLTQSQCNVRFTSTSAIKINVHALNFLLNPFRLGDLTSGGGAGLITVQDEGAVTVNANTLNFVGGGVIATQSAPGVAQITVPALNVLDEGSAVANAVAVNFVGAGVTASNTGPGQVQVTIPGTATPVHIFDEGVDLGAVASLNFVGAGVVASGASAITVTVPAPSIQAQDEGSPVVNATAINFVGAGVVCTQSAPGVAQVEVAAGGIQSVECRDEGAVVANVQSFDFVGGGVTASLESAGIAKILIPEVVTMLRGVRAASTGNIAIGAPGAGIDGVVLSAGDRILLKDQTTPNQNGIYVWNGAAAPLTRAPDAAASAQVPSHLEVVASEGTTNSDVSFTLITAAPIVLGTTALAFVPTSTLAPDGTLALPGIAFKAERTTGLRRVSPGIVAVTAGGADVLQLAAAGASWDGVNFLKNFSGIKPFAPGFTFGGASVGMSLVQTGMYARLGPFVYVTAQIGLLIKGTSTGVAQLQNLPFPASAAVSIAQFFRRRHHPRHRHGRWEPRALGIRHAKQHLGHA